MADDELDERQLYSRAEAVLDAVLDLPAADRPVAIAGACGGDAPLRARVEALLAALDRADRFLADPAAGADRQEVAPVTERPGTRIGRYTLREQLGEGGFGVVFLAEQTEPVRRQVALKVIKLGMDTREVVARFEAERQALAMMDHPNIARVFDAGSTDAGRPYFVMELVQGQPITAYADRHRLTAPRRVELLAAVCRAVQHAHGRGIIHRDLKPSNVLVAEHDGVAVPKVIDFGIAKATRSVRLTDRTLFTAARQLVGTPQYMSPEQADDGGADVDVRTDVYSLGVVLYELLTGTTPHDGRALRSAALKAMRQMIREDDPARPSTRLSSLGDTLATVAVDRGTDAKRLGQLVRGELDWIVMRALEKDRGRRYDTAAAMADDLGRYLAGEAVVAGPVSGAYRLRKFAGRHRAAIGVGSVVAASLLLGVAGTVWGLVRATGQRRLADAQRRLAEQRQGEAERARAEADGQRAAAESASDRAQAEVEFLAAILERARPALMPDRAVRDRVVHDMIEPVAATAARQFAGRPLAEVQVRFQVGQLYESLGRADLVVPMMRAADEVARRSLPPGSVEALNARLEYAHALQIDHRPAEAEPLARSVAADLRRTFGPDDARAVRAGLTHALILADLDRLDEAVPLVRQGYDQSRRTLGADVPATLDAACLLADFLRRAGRLADAESVAADTLGRARRTLGDEHPVSLSAAFLEGRLLVYLPRYAEAGPLLAAVCEHNHRVLGDDHPATLSADAVRANVDLVSGRNAEAIAGFDRAWGRARRSLGEDHAVTLSAELGYAVALNRAGRWAEAEPVVRDVLGRFRRTAAASSEGTLRATTAMAQTLHGLGRGVEAEPIARDALDRGRRAFGDGHPLVWSAAEAEAAVLHGLGRDAEAAPWAEQAWVRTRAVSGDGHPDTVRRRELYASVLRSLGRGAEAPTLPTTAPSSRP